MTMASTATTRHRTGTMRYRYRAIDRAGSVVNGTVEATSSRLAFGEIETRGLVPISVSELRTAREGTSRRLARRPSGSEITWLTYDLAMLINSGTPLDRALAILPETGVRPPLVRLLQSLRSAIVGGKSFAAAVAEHPAAFPPVYVKMIEVAEAAGNLGQTLELIAQERMRSEKLRRRITSALAYPAFLVLASFGVLVFVLTAIIPEFERALIGLEGELGGSAETIFAISRFLRGNLVLIGSVAVVSLSACLIAANFAAVRSFFFRIFARLPGIRPAVQHEQVVVVCSTLGTLMSSGVDISSALRLIRDLMRDRASAEKLDRTIRGVRQGRRLGDVLHEVNLLPRYAVHLLRIGEETGDVVAAASRTAQIYEDRLNRYLDRAASVIGPVVLVGVSVLIGWTIFSVLSALLSVNELLLTGSHHHGTAGLA